MKWRYEETVMTIRSDISRRTELQKPCYALYRGAESVGYVYDIVLAGRIVDTMNTTEGQHAHA